MSEYVNDVTDENFENEVLKSEKLVLVDFWAEWCGPCKMLAPTVEAVARQYNGRVKFVKIDIDANNQVPQRYGIKGIPTLLLFKGGNETDRAVGNQSKEKISQMIDRSLGSTVADTKS